MTIGQSDPEYSLADVAFFSYEEKGISSWYEVYRDMRYIELTAKSNQDIEPGKLDLANLWTTDIILN